jgi:hypothetical protein
MKKSTMIILALLTAIAPIARSADSWSDVKSVEQTIDPADAAEETRCMREIAGLLYNHNTACARLGSDGAMRQADMIVQHAKKLAARNDDDTFPTQFLNAAKVWAKQGFPTAAIQQLNEVFDDMLTAWEPGSKYPEDRDLVSDPVPGTVTIDRDGLMDWDMGPSLDKTLPLLFADVIVGKQDAARKLHITGLQNLQQPNERCARLIEVLSKRYKARAEAERTKL